MTVEGILVGGGPLQNDSWDLQGFPVRGRDVQPRERMNEMTDHVWRWEDLEPRMSWSRVDGGRW